MSRRADMGSGSFARPDEKMGNMRGNPMYGEKNTTRWASPSRKIVKRLAARKRRQRDRRVEQ